MDIGDIVNLEALNLQLEEDSEDFTENEAQRATVTVGPDDLVQWIITEVRAQNNKVSKFALQDHQLRRKHDHLYYRVRLVAQHEPDRVLVFQVDWVKQESGVL